MKKGGRKYKSCHAEKGIFPPLSLDPVQYMPLFFWLFLNSGMHVSK